VTTTATEPRPEPPAPANAAERSSGSGRFVALRSTALVTVLSLVVALAVGAVLIAAASPGVQDSAGYFFSRPGDLLRDALTTVRDAYSALLRGAVFDWTAESTTKSFRPLTESLVFATPLIAAGLAVALAFRAGLFNIGAEGQVMLGAIGAGYVGFAWHLPVVVHVVVAVVAAILLGALWGGIPGILKARTGAHEVITTIMLNYVARFLLAYLLTTSAFQRPGRNDPISPQVDSSAELPKLLGSSFRLHAGLLVAVGAAVFVWWLLNRSALGFQFRAVGENPHAARTAGIDVKNVYLYAMLISGALAGLAGATQILGTEKSLTGGISANIGFDAITVALLGRGKPLGTVLAGLLFGALRAGGVTMQARTGTPIDIVLVVQSIIVLLIAAPPLVRAIFRLRQDGGAGALQLSKGWNA
jgi:simple sugar transport system permease protein